MALRRKSSFSGGDSSSQELDMTPMLDVVFILLIFFIVTAVFVKEPGVEVDDPRISSAQQVKPSILVAVTGDEQIWINKREVDRRELRPVLEGLRAENPKGTAIIQGDNIAKFGLVYEVMETLQELGIESQYVSAMPAPGN